MAADIDSVRTNAVAATASGAWTIHRSGWQFASRQQLNQGYVLFFGAFSVAWDHAMVARWSADPLGMLWPEMDAAFVTSGGGDESPPAGVRRPVSMV